jgi:hypothetical protein
MTSPTEAWACVALCASRLRRGVGGKAPIRRVALIASMVALASCGFEPLHSKAYRDTLTVDLSAIEVNVASSAAVTATARSSRIPRRYSELLKAEIEDNVNPRASTTEKRFILDLSFTENDVALFVNPDGTASRGDLYYGSNYSIKRLRDGVVVASGSITRVSSYNSSPTAAPELFPSCTRKALVDCHQAVG